MSTMPDEPQYLRDYDVLVLFRLDQHTAQVSYSLAITNARAVEAGEVLAGTSGGPWPLEYNGTMRTLAFNIAHNVIRDLAGPFAHDPRHVLSYAVSRALRPELKALADEYSAEC